MSYTDKINYFCRPIIELMKQAILIFLCLCSISYSSAQAIIFKKTAQRSDVFVNNAWQGKDSFLFTYNADTSLTNLHALQFANNNWGNWYRYTYTLTPAGKISVQIRENWTAGAWVNNNRYTYTYDSLGNTTDILYEAWNAGNWVPTGKIVYTGYNAFGKFQSETVYGYSGGMFVTQTKKDRTYVNNQTLIATEEKYIWGNNNWNKLERLSYTYVQNEVGSIIRLLPDANANWAPADKYIYNYNFTPFYLTEYIAQVYDTLTLSWINDGRVVYTWNADTLLDKTQDEDFVNNAWLATKRAQYIYDANKNKIEYFTEVNNGGWNKDLRSVYTYGNNVLSAEERYQGSGNAWQLIKKLSYLYDGNQNMTYEKDENFDGVNFLPLSQAFYYYGAYPVQVSQNNTTFENLTLYPNPASDEISIQLSVANPTQIQVNLIDLFGRTRLIRTEPLPAGQTLIQLPLAGLSNGLYFATLLDLQKNSRRTEKFQILR